MWAICTSFESFDARSHYALNKELPLKFEIGRSRHVSIIFFYQKKASIIKRKESEYHVSIMIKIEASKQ